MKSWTLVISLLLNLVLLWLLVFLNDRYGLWAKVQRVALEEGRVPGLVSQHEWNRNYQVRREMFRLDRNQAARVLMLGDSLTAQGEWNAMLGVPLVANRGVDGDTSAGVLARIGDDADFRGDTLVIWIGTNDVLQGGSAAPVAERIMEAARGKAAKLKAGRPTADSGGLIADSEATSQRRTDSKGLIAGRPKLVPSSATVDALDAGLVAGGTKCLRPGDSADGDLLGGGEGTECHDSGDQCEVGGGCGGEWVSICRVGVGVGG